MCVALIGDSPYKSPSDWLLLPSPLLGTLIWCLAADCSGDQMTWMTADIYEQFKKKGHWTCHALYSEI